MANSVIEMTREQGAYLLATMRKGNFIYFAVYNSDFNEYTRDGKRTFHTTATAIYQQQEKFTDTPNRMKLRLQDQKARDRSLKNLPTLDFVPCYAPKAQQTKGNIFDDFKPGTNLQTIRPYYAQEIVWLLSRSIRRTTKVDDVQAMDTILVDNCHSLGVPSNTSVRVQEANLHHSILRMNKFQI